MHDRTSRLLVAAGAACLVAPVPVAGQGLPQVGGTLVVVNKSADTATLLDLATGEIAAALPTGRQPHEVAVSPDGRLAVVTDYGGREAGSSLTVLDVPAARVVRTIDLGRHTRPHGIAFLAGDRVAVTSEDTRSVLIVDLAAGEVERALDTDGRGSHMLALARGHVYTGNIADGTVSEIALDGSGVTRSFEVPPQPEAIGTSPDGEEVWVGSNSEGSVTAVSTADGSTRPVARGFAWPYRILFTSDGERVVVPDFRGDRTRVLDAASGETVREIEFGDGAGPQGVALGPRDRWLFQSLSRRGRLAVVDLRDGSVAATLDVGPGPDGVAWTPLRAGTEDGS